MNRAGFWSAMASNVTNQSRNVLSKKVMVKQEVTWSVDIPNICIQEDIFMNLLYVKKAENNDDFVLLRNPWTT